jgi:Minor capsid protein
MGVKLTFKADKLLQAVRGSNSRVGALVAERVLFDMRPFTPFDTGYLADSGSVVDNRIVYTAPYARFLYYGNINPLTRGHPLATTLWFEVAKGVHYEKWRQLAAQLLLKDIRGEL